MKKKDSEEALICVERVSKLVANKFLTADEFNGRSRQVDCQHFLGQMVFLGAYFALEIGRLR